MGVAFLDDGKIPGTWRAAREPNASCAACQQSICSHDDLTYAGIAPAMFLKSAPVHAEGGRSNTPGAAANHSGKEISPFVPAGTPGSGFRHANDIAGFSTVGKRDEDHRTNLAQVGSRS